MANEMTDPIAPLADIRIALLCHSPGSRAYQVALAELERRARIEARRDAFDGIVEWRKHRGLHQARVRRYGLVGTAYYTGTGPDYHTALEAALNAAGAP